MIERYSKRWSFVQDVNMKDGGPEDTTIITVENEDFNKTLEYLTEHYKVQQSQKDAGEIMIKAQKIINHYLNHYLKKRFIQNILKHAKALYVILTLILIREVINNENFTTSQI